MTDGTLGRTARREGGMTLLEVLIAISLLAVGVAGMMAMQVLAMRDEAIARESHDASRIARDVMEQVQRMPWAQVAVTGPGYQTADFIDLAGYNQGEVPVQVRDRDGNMLDQHVYDVSWQVQSVVGQPSLRTVDVQVAYTDSAEVPRVYTASTLKYNP